MIGRAPIDIFREVEAVLAAVGIHDREIGFYDHPAFVAEERRDRDFLRNHAAYVRFQPYDEQYLERVRSAVPIVSRILHQELLAERRLGACVDMSMVLSRILERLGIWNYMVKGALTLSFPSQSRIPTQYFWPEDVDPMPGHVWVAAPPFQVIDLTIGMQPFAEKIRRLMPPFVLLEAGEPYRPDMIDICSPEIRGRARAKYGRVPPDLHFMLRPALRETFALFPALKRYINKVCFRYITCAIGAPEEPLEEIQNQKWNGRYGLEILNELILPALKGT